MQEVLERPSLKKSWAYQYRLVITAVVLIAAWVYVAGTAPWIARGSVADWSLDAAGWIAFLGGSLYRIWATVWIAGRKKQNLVDDGPYRMCRNPLYVGTFAMGLGLALLLKSIVFVAGLGLIVALYTWFVVPAEERYMRSRFTDAYDDFCRRVPRWIPRPGLLRKDELLRESVNRGALYREIWRMAFWILLPILAEITSHLRGMPL